MKIAVVVIDEERTFADALAIRLNTEEDLTVATAAPWPGPNTARHADVILADADLPGAIRFCRAAWGASNRTAMIMLSRTSEPSRILAAIKAGARSWIRKDESVEQLLRVLRGVARGETWLPPAETGAVLSLLLMRRGGREQGDRLLARLTSRERDVLICLAEGASRHQVAERLNLKPNTVRTHLQNIMAKLGVHSTLEAVMLTRAELAAADEQIAELRKAPTLEKGVLTPIYRDKLTHSLGKKRTDSASNGEDAAAEAGRTRMAALRGTWGGSGDSGAGKSETAGRSGRQPSGVGRGEWLRAGGAHPAGGGRILAPRAVP
jgi:DNA-binding NarL/FixJ family response regulator